ncbi:NAD(P)-dependent oxidoreductase [Legionella qingyii]|uniref:NAD(P)-dependent oxidoreductase n=1 Tax=Legionella qingyii TaxID=2184757 RepID=A0A317U6D8_9GAMM|nr:SDR family oxidoreductase [Legionella qingyii]PWY56758.1 NAD(P)-dependent oxidoreductase [Legionella qingyii]RUR23687.1 SDR family oxidoreductase [Legionella qingyii]RUR26270.1 SDR family oxidoreductase [Legionella qingyii]
MVNHPNPPCFFIFGFGYTAEFLARELAQLNFKVVGTTRDKHKILNSTQKEYKLIDFDGDEVAFYLSKTTHILVSIPPSERGEPVLSRFSDLIIQSKAQIQWLGYLSSTGVYGDHHGAWVTEESDSIAAGPQAKLRLVAENNWMDFARTQGIPLHILRLAGIYGPHRNAIERIIGGKKVSIYKEGQVFSRIHVADIAAVIRASIKNPRPYSIYNVADDEPTPAHIVDAFAASLLNRAPLPLLSYETATMSPMEQQFYASNRRVSNAKIKEELKINLLYPSYREGLTQLFKDSYKGKNSDLRTWDE